MRGAYLGGRDIWSAGPVDGPVWWTFHSLLYEARILFETTRFDLIKRCVLININLRLKYQDREREEEKSERKSRKREIKRGKREMGRGETGK